MVVGGADWPAYLEAFHAEHPGITERILRRCRSDGIDPYMWCATPVADRPEPVLDIGCGSAPMAAHLRGWIGTDCSAAELATATGAGRGPLIRSSATHLPVAGSAVDAVVCSMAMQVIQPVEDAFAELARVLRPAGRAVLLLPTTGPLGRHDAFTYLHVEAALRRRIRYPNDRALDGRRLAATAASRGLSVINDERRAFLLSIASDDEIVDLVRSLYLPGIRAGRRRHAERVLTRRVSSELAVPLRRVVLDRAA